MTTQAAMLHPMGTVLKVDGPGCCGMWRPWEINEKSYYYYDCLLTLPRCSSSQSCIEPAQENELFAPSVFFFSLSVVFIGRRMHVKNAYTNGKGCLVKVTQFPLLVSEGKSFKNLRPQFLHLSNERLQPKSL